MKVELSNYLQLQKNILKKLVNRLSQEFEYVFILGVDTKGKSYMLKKTGVELNDSRCVERGFVVRVYNGTHYSEHSFNEISEDLLETVAQTIMETATTKLQFLRDQGVESVPYGIVSEEIKMSDFSEVGIHPKDLTHNEKLHKMKSIMDGAFLLCDELVDFRMRYEEVHVSKVFLSQKKDLEQAYIWTNASIIPIAKRGDIMRYTYLPFSGMMGVEILEQLEKSYEAGIENVLSLLDADPSPKGEFDIICNPEVAGLIAHEAFGHGVEMDMFVKNRAKAMEYLDQQVASTQVTMHDGSATASEVSSYLFDDEGTLGTDTKIIEAGILKRGISDVLSALQLGTQPTGNGKRESFERKAYTRMTNTVFKEGSHTLEEMILSIDQGYLLEGYMSGMEDPKNWGIQCVIIRGLEIIAGKLTGKVISPVYLTGYVPDLLKSMTMLSGDIAIRGTGYCGKGHKELVKTAQGGPYIKARGRLS